MIINRFFAKNAYIFFTAIYVCVAFIAKDIPFFWDIGLYAEMANYFLDNNFDSIFTAPHFDNGNPTTYALLIAAFWKIFEKSLLLSHFLLIPFILGIFYELQRICKFYMSILARNICMFLIAIEPVFLSQFVYMGYDIVLIFFVLLGYRAVLNNQKILIIIATVGLVITNLRGIPYVFVLFLIQIFFTPQKSFKQVFINYFPSVLIFLMWAYAHKLYSGWYVFSPVSAEHRQWVSFWQFIKNIAFSYWKLFDFGRIVLYIIIGIIAFFKHHKFKQKAINLFIHFALFCDVIILFIAPFSNPISHRYFMIPTIFAVLLAVWFIQDFLQKKQQIVVYISIVIVFLTGHFWYYPEKYGNGWDVTLKTIPYFDLYKKAIKYTENNNIEPQKIGVKFPMYINTKDSYLVQKHFLFGHLENKKISDFEYVLFSNVCNNYTIKERNTIKNEWQVIKTFKKRQTYLTLYKQPK